MGFLFQIVLKSNAKTQQQRKNKDKNSLGFTRQSFIFFFLVWDSSNNTPDEMESFVLDLEDVER